MDARLRCFCWTALTLALDRVVFDVRTMEVLSDSHAIISPETGIKATVEASSQDARKSAGVTEHKHDVCDATSCDGTAGRS